MKSAEEWALELEFVVDVLSAATVAAIQADATSDLQSQVEQLIMQKEWCLKEMTILTNANNLGNSEAIKLRTALEKCVSALESIRDFDDDSPFDDPGCIAVDALATAKPLLNKP